MTSNFTESEQFYFNINTAINVCLFFLIILPSLILCLVCVLGLIFASDIHLKIRVPLINLIISVAGGWLSLVVLFLGYPFQEASEICGVYGAMYFGKEIYLFSALTLHAATVYLFVKYGLQKLKWHYIVLYLILSWIATFVFFLVPLFHSLRFSDINGFCYLREQESLVVGYLTILVITIVSLWLVFSMFSFLSYLHTKKNVLHEDVEIKRASLTYLFYLSISAFLFLVGSILPSSFMSIRAAFQGEELLLAQTLIKCSRMLFQLPTLIILIAAVIIFKPVHSTLKHGCVQGCVQCRKKTVLKYLSQSITRSQELS
jgi:hypothetical protein